MRRAGPGCPGHLAKDSVPRHPDLRNTAPESQETQPAGKANPPLHVGDPAMMYVIPRRPSSAAYWARRPGRFAPCTVRVYQVPRCSSILGKLDCGVWPPPRRWPKFSGVSLAARVSLLALVSPSTESDMLKSTSEKCPANARAEKLRADQPGTQHARAALAATIGRQVVRAKGSGQIEDFGIPKCPHQSTLADDATLGQVVTNCSARVRGRNGASWMQREVADIITSHYQRGEKPRTSSSHTPRPYVVMMPPSAHALSSRRRRLSDCDHLTTAAGTRNSPGDESPLLCGRDWRATLRGRKAPSRGCFQNVRRGNGYWAFRASYWPVIAARRPIAKFAMVVRLNNPDTPGQQSVFPAGLWFP